MLYLLHLYNITNPALARKTPHHAKRPKPAVNLGSSDAAAKTWNKLKKGTNQRRAWCKLSTKSRKVPKMTECVYVTSSNTIKHQSMGGSPNLESFPRRLFLSHLLSSNRLAFPCKIKFIREKNYYRCRQQEAHTGNS